FESETARDTARTRLLKAAKRYRIVPVGFITGQVVTVRARAEIAARESDASSLPRGIVTFLFSDIEDSTGLTRQLGNRYARLLAETRSLLRTAVSSSGGYVVDIRAGELFAVFKGAPDALGGGDLEVDIGEPGGDQRVPIIGDRDRARDASGPLVQCLLDRRFEWLELDHVGDREPTSWPQDPERFLDDSALVLGEVDDAVGDDDVDSGLRQRDAFDGSLQKGGIRHSGPGLVAG